MLKAALPTEGAVETLYRSVANSGTLGPRENRAHEGELIILPKGGYSEDDKGFHSLLDGTVLIPDSGYEFADDIRSSAQLKAFCGAPDWTKIDAGGVPERYVLSLIMHVAGTNAVYSGTGVLISPRCILTAGHNVHYRKYPSRGWVSRIEAFAGRNGDRCAVASSSSTFRSIEAWVQGDQSLNDFDIAAIILPDDAIFQWAQGHFGVDPRGSAADVRLLGYPWQKGVSNKMGHQYTSSGPAQPKGKVLEYRIDSYSGQSGGAVFPSVGAPSLVGIHVGGNCPNQCIAIDQALMQRIVEWTEL
jgi:V8-like Glu-specific endopeptidase